ncbi:hypothetical protein Droror1_Dr00022118 [Drosera rotundifolia]
MNRYKILKELGDGTCGSVYKAVEMETYEIVAIKKMKRKFYVWDECMNLKELKCLRKLSHPNIIKLKEAVMENNELFFIFEYMEHNLYQIMKERQMPFSEEEIRCFMQQILQGLTHMHRNGYFHRDLKPENLLVTNDLIKIGDFGLAREVLSMPPYTDYVSTRWYRAPEVLLQSTYYTPAIDMWAVGAILAELFALSPIFPGESEIDQLYKICSILGAPDWTAFPDAKNITQLINISYSEFFPANLSEIISHASLEAIDLISQLFHWDPQKRPTAEQCLQHPFFVGMWIPRPIHDQLHFTQPCTVNEPNLELNLWDFETKTDDCYLGLTLAVNPSISRDLMPQISRGTGQDIYLCSGFQDLPQQSACWSLFSPRRSGANARVEPPLSLSFGGLFSRARAGGSHPAGFGMTPLQSSSVLDGPLLAASSSHRQQDHYF